MYFNNSNEVKPKEYMKTADILRGVFKPEEYDKIILPMVLLKRFDSVLEDVKDEIYVVSTTAPPV